MLAGIWIALVGHVTSIEKHLVTATILVFGPVSRQLIVTIDLDRPHASDKAGDNVVGVTKRCAHSASYEIGRTRNDLQEPSGYHGSEVDC